MQNAMDARRHGTEIVYQDPALCDNPTQAANVFLGRKVHRRFWQIRILDYPTMYRRVREIFADL